jgi:hypothetical protein
LLPDLAPPEDRLLKNLALYWDELVIPVDRRQAPGDSRGAPLETDVYASLRDVGVIREVSQLVATEEVVPPSRGHEVRPDGAIGPLAMGKDAGGRPKLERMIYMKEEQLQEANSAPEDRDELVQAMATLWADIALKRLSKARALAASQHLAPPGVLGRGSPRFDGWCGRASSAVREAALISAAIQAFEIDPSVDLDAIIAFREKHWREMGRLRASLTDLADALDASSGLDRLMAQARDVVRNRIEPALGDLEAVLKENRIKFMIKSVVGLSALTVGAVQPVAGLERAGALSAQTVNYRFSREALVREHPYGYLHRLAGWKPSATASRHSGFDVTDPRQLMLEVMEVLARSQQERRHDAR